ncbi:MAG: right-handed parallel beta-helix repeat-containing protein, partial [Candidatus Binatia bacterium]
MRNCALRVGVPLVGVGLLGLLTFTSACGSHGSTGNGGGRSTVPVVVGTPTPPPPTQPGTTPTTKPTVKTVTPGTVSPTPTSTATPEPTAVPTLIVPSGESIADAAKSAPPGATIIVSPGLYGAVVFQPGDLADGLYFFADVTGEFTDSAAAPVVIDAHGGSAAVMLSGQSNVTFDSFTLRGGSVAGILARNSPGTLIEDCVIAANHGDGVLMQGGDGELIFNNLITNSGGAGISAGGTTDLQIINNTVYNSTQSGLSVGSESSNVFVENNIFNRNRSGMGVAVDATATGFAADFNLNTDGYQGTATGEDDVHSDPLFLFPSQGDPTTNADFHLAQGSPAIDAGDTTIDADLLGLLEQLTTQSDGTLDSPPPDLGYHYLAPATPTPAVKATRTPTPRPATPKPGTPSPTPRPGTPTPTRRPATASP